MNTDHVTVKTFTLLQKCISQIHSVLVTGPGTCGGWKHKEAGEQELTGFNITLRKRITFTHHTQRRTAQE